MFPGGWNSQIETNNTEYYPGPVQSALEKIEMIPCGWISQRKAASTQHHPGHPVKYPFYKHHKLFQHHQLLQQPAPPAPTGEVQAYIILFISDYGCFT